MATSASCLRKYMQPVKVLRLFDSKQHRPVDLVLRDWDSARVGWTESRRLFTSGRHRCAWK